MSKPALYQRDPQETSVLAAVTVDTGTQEEQVATFLRGCGAHGATDQEMQRALGIQRARTRRQAWQERGLVVDSGRRRETESGKSAIVWVWAAEETVVKVASTGRTVTRRCTRKMPAPVALAPAVGDLRRHEPKPKRGSAQSKKPVERPQRPDRFAGMTEDEKQDYRDKKAGL